MREIKFRAWNVDKMIYFDLSDLVYGDDGFFDPHLPEEYRADWGKLDESKVMQYTGLKDKNGKEIYEGDVVQSKDWHKAEDGSCILSEENSYMKHTLIDWKTALYQGFYVPSKCEIIGNIYENPELLTK